MVLRSTLKIFLKYDLFVRLSVCMSRLTPPQPFKESSRNYQGLIRAPHLISLQKFHSDWKAMGDVLSLDGGGGGGGGRGLLMGVAS